MEWKVSDVFPPCEVDVPKVGSYILEGGAV